ncbi:hypothetical protein FQZ97_942120 [compost metagenome]
MPVMGNVFIELHVHRAILRQRVHGAGLGLARLQPAQGLGNRHLEHHGLARAQRRFRDAMAGLDDGRLGGALGGLHAGHAAEEAADIDGVGGVVGTLVDYLEHIGLADDGGGDLDAARTPAVGQRHFAAAERDLVAGDRHGLEQGAAQHALGRFVEVTEVVVLVAGDARGGGCVRGGHASVSSCGSDSVCDPAGAAAALVPSCSPRRRRSSSRLAWKST